jgi:hypothetical protein
MSKTDTTDTENARPSRKREVTATVASTAVTVVLGIAASYLTNKVADRVHKQIAPQPE